jgi:hypothetical protein
MADPDKVAAVWHARWARGLDYPTKGADRRRQADGIGILGEAQLSDAADGKETVMTSESGN